MITSPSRPQGLELKTEPITKLSEVHIALKALGAKTLDDYALEAVATSRDHFDLDNQGQPSAPMASDDYLNDLDALALSSPRLTPSKRPRDGEQDADDNAEEAAPLLSTSSTGPLSLLPITVHSKLAKKMALSRTGSIHESFKREPGKTAVSTLNEFAQQAALRAPEYAHTSQQGLRCSPDHYVTLRFEGHAFHDEKGSPSIKAGREVCAKLCLDYFFPEEA